MESTSTTFLHSKNTKSVTKNTFVNKGKNRSTQRKHLENHLSENPSSPLPDSKPEEALINDANPTLPEISSSQHSIVE